ncbi:hypothetical protein H1235_08295 [Pseudoxanthomonas sp. NC8]|nr:hypothetical protein H1235_08295 [Pseudoxanthomonas sp. NC8]
MEFTRVDRADDTMALREDGTFSTGAARVSADARADEVSGTPGSPATAAAAGRPTTDA